MHPSQCGASDPLPVLFAAAFTLIFSYDNFKVALDDAYKAFQERATGRAQVVICVVYVFMKIYESLEDLPVVRRLKSLIRLPTWPANNRIHRDTAIIVIISYVLLLDINLSYIWLAIFPAIAIAFIYALRIEFCPPGEAGELADSSNGDQDKTTQGPQKALKALAAVPFVVLLVMAQLDDGTTDWFAISQFLLFLSTTLGALTYMMMSLPAGPGIAPASELLHKAFLLLLLVTLHTLAAEALGEDVVLFCMLELLPVILWFSLHLDRDSSIISADKVTKLRRNMLIVSGGVVMVAIGPIVAYLAFATSMDVSRLPWCTVTMKSAGVSGLLTYYMAFMLRQWPGRQRAAAGKVDDVAAADISSLHSSKTKGGKRKGATGSEEASQSEEQDAGKAVDNVAAANTSSLQSTKKKSGKGDGKGATGSSEGAAKSKEQAAAGSSEEAVHVQLLELWAIFLLIPAAASLLLLLKIVVAPT